MRTARNVVRMVGGYVAGVTLSSGAGAAGITPGMFPRAASVSASFEFYRFTKLRFRILATSRSSISSPVDIVAGYLPEETGETSSYGSTLELLPNTHFASNSTAGTFAPMTCHSDWAVVPRRVLCGNTPTRWFKTNAASTEDLFVQQGVVPIHSSSASDAGVMYIEFRYELEFTGIEASQEQPRPRAIQVDEKEDAVLVEPPATARRPQGLRRNWS